MPGAKFSYRHHEKLFSLAESLLHRVTGWSEVLGAARDRAASAGRPSGSANAGCSSGPGTPTGWGRSTRPMMYVIMALDLLGYPPDHPDRVEARAPVRPADGGRRRSASSSSPASRWCGTRPSRLFALGESGAAPRQAVEARRDWLLSKEVRRKGDWSVKRPNLEPVGLVFRIRQRVLPGHRRHGHGAAGAGHARASDGGGAAGSAKRAIDWLLAHAIEGRRLGGVRRGQQPGRC